MKKLINLFVSIKCAIAIIFAIMVLSAVGTLIPQNLEPEAYLNNYPNIGNALLRLGFDDVYHGGVFMSLIVLLALSTILCTSFRCKNTYARLFGKVEEKTKKKIKSFNLSFKCVLSDSQKEKYKIIKEDEYGELRLKRSGVYSLVGALVLHIGLVFALAGYAYGLYAGVETTISGYKGSMEPIVAPKYLKIAKEADKLRLKALYIRATNPNDSVLNKYRQIIEQSRNEYYKALEKPAFKVLFNDLWIDYNDESNKIGIKSWNSDISFVKDNSIGKKQVVRVNQPVKNEDYYFYQSGWGKTYPAVKVRVELSPYATEDDLKSWNINKEDFPIEVDLTINSPQKFDWCNHLLELTAFYPDLKLVNGRAVTMSNELYNPAAQIVAHKTETEKDMNRQWRAWAFPNAIPGMEGKTSNMPLVFYFVSAASQHLSILAVKYDPGENIMWLGCLMFSLGIVLCFSGVYKEEWIYTDKNGRSIAAIGGNRHENAYLKSFQEFKTLLAKD